MLSTDDFILLLGKHIRVGQVDISLGSTLRDDLGVDSFGLLELLDTVTKLGVDFSEQDWMTIVTVEDLYRRYEAQFVEEYRYPARGGSIPELATADVRQSDDEQGGEASPPVLSGKYFRLTPVLPSSVPFLYKLAISPEIGFRWRYRGSVPHYAQFEAELWRSVLTQFVVESIATGEPVGNVICYKPDLTLGHAYIGAAMSPAYGNSGIAIEPVALFVQYLFDVWPLRKIYLEMPEFNYQQFSSTDGAFTRVEARFTDHDYYKGRYWDRIVIAVYSNSLERKPSRTP